MQTRRHFLQSSALSAASAGAAPQKKPSANDHIQIATIGLGGRGTEDTHSAIDTGSARLVAVADLYQGRLIRAKEVFGNQVFTTRDYREVLARKDVDAVIVATSDHWHMQAAVDAMKAGKDVYCEKPLVQRVADGRTVIDTAKRTGRILQVGSQRVSSVVYQKAKLLLASGAIGEINLVEAWWDRNSANGAWQYAIPPDASPATVDWDRFLGSAPKRPFDPVRMFRWRCYRDYGSGVAGDLFVHLFSGMHFVTGALGPTRVFATGGLRFWKDGRDVPDVMVGLYDYPACGGHPAFNLALRVNFVNGGRETSGFRFVGSDGVLSIDNGVTVSKAVPETEPGYTIGTFPKAVRDQFLKEYLAKYPPWPVTLESIQPQAGERYLPPRGYSDDLDHMRNFLAAVRSRKPVVEDAVFGFRAAGPALVSNISYFEQRLVKWDPAAIEIVS